KLIGDPNPAVAAPAPRALAKLPAEPSLVAPALGQVLATTHGGAKPRRAPAQPLRGIIDTLTSPRMRSRGRRSSGGAEPPNSDPRSRLQKAIPAVTVAVAKGLLDPDDSVRRLSIAALEHAAIAVGDLVQVVDEGAARGHRPAPGQAKVLWQMYIAER